MNASRILDFLKDIAANNNRPWFQAHKDENTVTETQKYFNICFIQEVQKTKAYY